MEAQKVDMFMMTNGKFFESHSLGGIRDSLLSVDENRWSQLQITQFKDPTTILIVSLLAGVLGIDRFMIGDTGMGIGKLLTCGGLGIWALIDLFLIMVQHVRKTKKTYKEYCTKCQKIETVCIFY